MKQLTLALLLASGSVQLSQGLWIHIKANLAQTLIASAWAESRRTFEDIKPWSWADTWPVAKLVTQTETLYILAGVQGNSLAFGPGHMFGTAIPGEPGLSIVAGHRDTHFAFLQHISVGDLLSIENRKVTVNYRIVEKKIADIRQGPIQTSTDQNKLILVTCYPFDQIPSGGPLRYVVTARPVSK